MSFFDFKVIWILSKSIKNFLSFESSTDFYQNLESTKLRILIEYVFFFEVLNFPRFVVAIKAYVNKWVETTHLVRIRAKST